MRTPLRVLVAPASFKGSLSASHVGEAIRRGLARVLLEAEVRVVPLADGGEGTVEALHSALGGELRRARVTGPLGPDPVEAVWLLLPDDGTAVVEMAQASGLPLVPPERRDPMLTTTTGTGELIREALDAGCRRVLVGLGGSATVDGGLGAVRALGVALLDDRGRPVPAGGRGLLALERVEVSGLDPRVRETSFVALADVDNPLVGPEGAARVFGPQKGADEAAVAALERGLERLASILRRDLALPFDPATLPGGGTAGGLGLALAAFLGARIVRGIDEVMAAARLEEAVRWADLVVTGEGQLDGQSPRGKVCSGVARVARAAGRPVVALVGGVKDEAEVVAAVGLDALLPVPPRPIALEEAMAGAVHYLEEAAARLARLLLAGRRLRGGPPASV